MKNSNLYQILLYKVGFQKHSYEFIIDAETEDDAYIYAGRYCATMNKRLEKQQSYCIMIRRLEGRKVKRIDRIRKDN